MLKTSAAVSVRVETEKPISLWSKAKSIRLSRVYFFTGTINLLCFAINALSGDGGKMITFGVSTVCWFAGSYIWSKAEDMWIYK